MEIRHIVPSDFPAVVDDLAELQEIAESEREQMLRTVQWWFFENPAGEGTYAGVFADGKLAGLASITPKRLWIRGEPVLGCEIGRTMTHAAFRGQGIFSKLVGHLVEESRSRGYEVIYGTPNQQSGRIYLGRLDFKALFHWDRAVRPVDWTSLGDRAGSLGRLAAKLVGGVYGALRPLTVEPYHITVEAEPDAAVPELIERARPAAPTCSVQRTYGYLAWRYARPGREYFSIHAREPAGGLVGWAVASCVQGPRGARIHVGDYWVLPGHRKALRALMGGAEREAAARGALEIYAAGRSVSDRRALRRFGFMSQPSPMPVIGFSPGGFDLTLLSDWEYRESDADMY